ncbi:MAG: hypothetical protein K0Q92_1668 [Steroidobacteraceae bacterium]|jgi:hypothetical protein|nr:hypothetical protein [Steroidobacteraceae bacterium]
MRRLLVCLALLAAPNFSGAAATDDPALAALEACGARLDARTDVGLERIAKRCPQLLPALRSAPWADLLPLYLRTGDKHDRRDEISARSLRELAELVRDSKREIAPRSAPDVADLAPVLAGLGEKGQQGVTRWERFKRWIKDKLERHEREDDQDSWLGDFGRQFETSEGVAQFITIVGYCCMGLLLAFVIFSELRAAGLFGGRRRNGARDKAREWRRRLQLADVMAAPLADRPGLLLQLLGEALTRANRLRTAAGLTAGALVRQARLDSAEERAELEQVASTAEAVRFAPSQPDAGKLEGAVTAARSLLDKLTRADPATRRAGR